VALPGIRAARGAEAPAMLVATRDPALLSALDAAFSPRGVRVAMADRPLRATGDDLGAGARGADLVWLCDLTPATAPPSPSGGAAPATALCVRPHQGTVIIRRIAVTTPLSPEDAAALALSVQVALMPNAAPPQKLARPAAPPVLADRSPVEPSGAHAMTFELGLGVAHAGSDDTFAHPSVAMTYMPWLGHRLGIGVAVGAMTKRGSLGWTGPNPPPIGIPFNEDDVTDTTVRLFSRRQARTGPVWLQLDLGPEAHIKSITLTEGGGPPGGGVVSHSHRLGLTLDGFVGAVIPFGRFFAGAHAGAAYALREPQDSSDLFRPRWIAEALATFGVGFF
jgi:hypothetical protein